MIKPISTPKNLYPQEPKKATKNQMAYTYMAARNLAEGFDWASSAEGLTFWEDIFHRLLQIGKDGILK